MVNYHFFDFLIIGNISTEFIVDLNNRPHNDLLGGSALYAAGGTRCWCDRIALISKTHHTHARRLQTLHKRYLVDIEGIKYPAGQAETKHFFGYLSPHEVFCGNPVPFYASRKIEFPKGLLDYASAYDRTPAARMNKFLLEDFPIQYRDICTALVCKCSLPIQLQLTSLLQKFATTRLILQASDDYMQLEHFEMMPMLLKDVTAFIATERQVIKLFQNRLHDKWEMLESLAKMGCENVIVEDSNFGHTLFQKLTGKRTHIPAYPAPLNDPTGYQESFCGGFMAGIKRDLDPIEGLLCGAISASFTAEGSGPFYCADAYPSLMQSRFNFAKKLIKKG